MSNKLLLLFNFTFFEKKQLSIMQMRCGHHILMTLIIL